MPSDSRPVRARIATALIFIANGYGIGSWASCIPGIKVGLGLTDAQLGLALLCFALGAIVAMPTSGWLAARFGTRQVTIAAAAIFATALSLPGQAPALLVLMPVAVALGSVNGLCDVAMNAHATLVERRWGGPIMSSFHAGFSLGGLSGAAGGGLLLGQGLTPAACLIVAACVVAALVAAAVFVGLGAGVPQEAAAPAAEREPAFVLPSRAMLGIGLLALLGMVVEGAIADWSGVFLATEAGASLAVAASGYAAFSVTMVVGRLAGDATIQALGERRVLRLGALLAAIGLTLALALADPLLSSLGFMLVGIGISNIVPVVFSLAGRSRSVAPSVGVSMAATLGYAGFLIAPPIIGLAAKLVGLREALVLLVAASVAILLLAGRILPKVQPDAVKREAASRAAT